MSESRLVACPTCGKNVEWASQNAFRPFCSERCKLIDLGAWATEKFRVPVTESNDQPEDAEPGDLPATPGNPDAR